MKYVTHPQVEAQQALIFGETPVNPKACPFMNKIEAGSCAKYHLNEPLNYYNTIKFWKTPIPDCGNGKNDCMNYNAWQTAWTQVTGEPRDRIRRGGGLLCGGPPPVCRPA